MVIRNDEYFEVLVQIASSSGVTWEEVVLAGRGISAYAGAQVWMLATGKSTVEAMRLGQLVVEFGETAELLPGLWDRYSRCAITRQDLKSELTAIVERLESWPGL